MEVVLSIIKERFKINRWIYLFKIIYLILNKNKIKRTILKGHPCRKNLTTCISKLWKKIIIVKIKNKLKIALIKMRLIITTTTTT